MKTWSLEAYYFKNYTYQCSRRSISRYEETSDAGTVLGLDSPRIFNDDTAKWRGSLRQFRVIRPDLKIWNAPWIRICILRRFRRLLAPARFPRLFYNMVSPRLGSFRCPRCKLQYSRARSVRGCENVCISQSKIKYGPPHSAASKETLLRAFSYTYIYRYILYLLVTSWLFLFSTLFNL